MKRELCEACKNGNHENHSRYGYCNNDTRFNTDCECPVYEIVCTCGGDDSTDNLAYLDCEVHNPDE